MSLSMRNLRRMRRRKRRLKIRKKIDEKNKLQTQKKEWEDALL